MLRKGDLSIDTNVRLIVICWCSNHVLISILSRFPNQGSDANGTQSNYRKIYQKAQMALETKYEIRDVVGESSSQCQVQLIIRFSLAFFTILLWTHLLVSGLV